MRFFVLFGQLAIGVICIYTGIGNVFELGWLLSTAVSNLLLGVGMVSLFSALYTLLGHISAANKKAAISSRRSKIF